MAKTFRFEKTELKTLPEKDHFKTPRREKLSEEEKCIIDNFWNLTITPSPPTVAKKLACCRALVSHLYWEKHKKPFTCYVMYTGPKAGVYLTWEEIVLLREELETSPRYGSPSYQGFYKIDEAIESATKNCGKDFIISPDVKKYQEYLKLFKTHFDQEFLNKSGNSPSALVLASSSSIQKRDLEDELFTKFSEKLEAPPQTSSKGKGVLVLEKPAQISTVIPRSTPPVNETTFQTFCLLQEFLAQVANTQIIHPGISTTWEFEFSYNPSKFCSSQFDNCPENKGGPCYCKLDWAIRKANIHIPSFKPFRFRDYLVTIQTLIQYGLIESIFFPPLYSDFSEYFPKFLAETVEQVVLETPRNTQLKFVSLYPDFEQNIPSFHLIDASFKGIDDEYTDFPVQNIGPKTIKIEEPLETQLDLIRAKIIASEFGWTGKKCVTKKLLREDRFVKVYCDSNIASKCFFPFDVEHSRPRWVEIFRNQIRRQGGSAFGSRPFSSDSSKRRRCD
ncbi:uncharacterized protein LOC116016707 [Ipomoea triloba]|uniref:uncharacterized protein LOC116016707 n=1 Tax=Ipomoea triloba TaxID=35885 RepID=UPI00125D5677|nr:uncharacterized protein LOC116016707 [Ipomoea triloba]